MNVADTHISSWASELASDLLSDLGSRWQHVRGVAKRAQSLAPLFDSASFAGRHDFDALLVVAYLHDVGYAPALVRSGFHPLDGAEYIRSLGHERVACLVAHHSEARFEADLRGLSIELARFPRERSIVADALIYCDILTGSTGEPVSLKERTEDIKARYGRDHVVAVAYSQALPYFSLAIGRTRRRLRQRGISA